MPAAGSGFMVEKAPAPDAKCCLWVSAGVGTTSGHNTRVGGSVISLMFLSKEIQEKI